ncbi:hypothetical protein PoB_007045500 [Plakobranchus ocellatus]|uniref:Uncharacterized protein n=1 Tax=Plakobranchus ocellatus TaxID=259542 RepID=A0AAV4DIX8_9GAST|nr:hypothetical protein PoB_007045500 [Plakobranchus ocellatus]
MRFSIVPDLRILAPKVPGLRSTSQRHHYTPPNPSLPYNRSCCLTRTSARALSPSPSLCSPSARSPCHQTQVSIPPAIPRPLDTVTNSSDSSWQDVFLVMPIQLLPPQTVTPLPRVKVARYNSLISIQQQQMLG